MKKFAALLIVLYLSYVMYLHFPQKFNEGECFLEQQTGEIYRSLTKCERDISFKDNWLFGPMKFEAELIKPNPNTLRKVGDRRFFYPSKDSLQLIKCE